MRFRSPYKGLQVLCRSATEPVYDPTGTVITREGQRRLTADFGLFESEATYKDPITGADMQVAVIRGGFFDTEAATEEKGWTDEEKAWVEKELVQLCEKQPEFIQIYEDAKAAPPWSNYDSANWQRIADLALELEVVPEALFYERENKNRPKVIEALEKAMGAAPQVETVDEDALVAS